VCRVRAPLSEISDIWAKRFTDRAVRSSVLQCVAVRTSMCTAFWILGRGFTEKFSSVCCSVLRCVAGCCSVLQCVAVPLSGIRQKDLRRDSHLRVAVCCDVLQCVAVYCSVLQCVAVRCSALQCVAMCCSVLQCVTVPLSEIRAIQRNIFICVLKCVAVCCSVMQCAAVPLSGIRARGFRECFHLCVAVCCSVLQCVAVCCSALRYRFLESGQEDLRRDSRRFSPFLPADE